MNASLFTCVIRQLVSWLDVLVLRAWSVVSCCYFNKSLKFSLPFLTTLLLKYCEDYPLSREARYRILLTLCFLFVFLCFITG